MSCFCETANKLSNSVVTAAAEHCAATPSCSLWQHTSARGVELALKMRRLDRLIRLFYNKRARLVRGVATMIGAGVGFPHWLIFMSPSAIAADA